MATGVLVLGIGKATRLMRFVTAGRKEYEAEITFGIETDTLDAEGAVTAEHKMEDLNAESVVSAATQFLGDIEQIPPMVSAIKVDGRRLHQLAREGIEVERKARRIHIDRFELHPTENPLVWNATVICSAGTYIRSLAADLGRELGGGAHLSALRRTAVGSFRIDQARAVEDPELLPVKAAVSSLPSVEVDGEMRAKVLRGSVQDREDGGFDGRGPWAVVDAEGELLAVYESFRDHHVKPAMVLATADSR